MFPTLYFNWLQSKQKPIVLSAIPDQKVKAGIYFDGDFEKYSPVLEAYTFLNWSEKFWSNELEYKLFTLFGEPSAFEIVEEDEIIEVVEEDEIKSGSGSGNTE